ncbi:glutamate decarboxylase [Microbotryum lychnidis-dioicae p1A1 Lamole]|uniref:Glutamate decarboxylase n=1 Tax=Microbotryum lychnidis-dioicae (strain p1A1 Lamole / MvSl-1064) TaxID=683840 RepID=U5H391_USTV1|nr:glutamate decarboxylase [Microbotryum lychnidis-dioicae p1A1 Lamole]|eukprot:KDE07904.1 glutamate decarboxylase [Microbotryum lychnidis-dioicae p1A1 Lamole]
MVLSTVPADSRVKDSPSEAHHVSSTVYGNSLARNGIRRFELPEQELPATIVQRFISDELLLDGNPAMNLASFVTTYQEPEAERLMMANLSKNFIDVEEYPSMGEIETRCVNIVARLFNAPLTDHKAEALGVSTIGSSEAIILAVLAAKRRWQIKRRAEGKSTEKPNLVMNAAVQVCWEKAARYLEVEERYWYCRPGAYVMDPKECAELCDENTILVCAILGTTYTGQYEDIKGINDEVAKVNKEKGLDVHIHVDGASGGFVAPFVMPDLEWDFRLPLVCSINASGHKYGLAYAGVGWLVFREQKYLPDEVVFTVNYLGSPQSSFTLNFSKSGVQVLGQYYQFLRLGRSGYESIMSNLTCTADYLSQQVLKLGGGDLFELMSETEGRGLPLVAWRIVKADVGFDEFAIAGHLRQRGWIVPAYTMAPHTDQMKMLRVVVREDFSRSRCEQFVRDLTHTVEYLSKAPKAVAEALAGKTQGEVDQDAEKQSEHHPASHAAKTKHVEHEKHSLRGKHKKTHAVC